MIMSSKTATPTIPVPTAWHTVNEAVRTLHSVQEQGQTVIVEYDCSMVAYEGTQEDSAFVFTLDSPSYLG